MSLEEKLNNAIAFQQAGQFEEALVLFQEVLKEEPQNINALYFSGIVEYRRGNISDALDFLNSTIEIRPQYEVYKLLGEIYYSLNKVNEATICFENAVKLNPQDFNLYFNLGLINHRFKKYKEALDYYKKVININAGHIKVYNNLANLMLELNQPSDAITCCKSGLSIEPSDSELHYTLGNIYQMLDKLDDAILCFEKVVELRPDDYQSLFILGVLYSHKKDLGKEIECYKKAIAANPKYAKAYFNLANLYYEKCEFDKALNNYEEAIVVAPDLNQAYSHLASVYIDLLETDKAIQVCEKGLKVKPDDKTIFFNLCKAHLTNGNIDEGWEFFKERRRLNEKTDFGPYLLDCEKIEEGKKVLVYSDSGLGDTIQFGRYAKLLSDNGVIVLFKPQKPLESLFEGLGSNFEVVKGDIPLKDLDFDYHINVTSLSYLFKSDINSFPLREGYLKADSQKVKDYSNKYFDNDKLKVGLVWNASNYTAINEIKSIKDIREFNDLLKLDDVQVYSLQKGEVEAQIKELPEESRVIDLGSGFKDFSDTAAAIENLDLLISVDTSVAHLGGSMGKSTRVILPKCSNWRWFRDIDTSPWYDSMKLFRQKELDNWSDVIADVVKEVKEKL